MPADASSPHSELRSFIERCDQTSIGMYLVEFDFLTERLASIEEQLEAAQRDNGRLALEAATADQDWKRAEAEANKLRHALTQVRAECDLPDYIAEFIGEALSPSSPNVRKVWGPERMRHDPERLS